MKRRLRTPLCPGEFDSKPQSKWTPGVRLTLTPFSAPFLLPEQGEIEVKAGIADSRARAGSLTPTHAEWSEGRETAQIACVIKSLQAPGSPAHTL